MSNMFLGIARTAARKLTHKDTLCVGAHIHRFAVKLVAFKAAMGVAEMTDAHTPGVWSCPHDEEGNIAVVSENGYLVTFAFPNGDDAAEANARRIVACVNALAGIPVAEIESGVVGYMAEALRDYVRAVEENAGAALGLAMSNEHPNPDEPLMAMFQKSQDLRERHKATFATVNLLARLKGNAA